MKTNYWCRALDISPPQLEKVAHHRDANTYALLIVALLERGEPMTLDEVAARFEEAKIADRSRALRSLKRCQPAKPPVYRDGEFYHLDPYDKDTALWAFRLGICPPVVPPGDPETLPQRHAEFERQRAAQRAELARMPRALLVAFPPERPEAVALLDVKKREITTYVGDEIEVLRSRLRDYEYIGAIAVRSLLRLLDFDPEGRRLGELGPSQKAIHVSGHSLELTPTMLVQHSCGIAKPFGEKAKLADHLAKGEIAKLRRRLESDLKSLYALYEYGRLHRRVRVHWGPIETFIRAPWVYDVEPSLFDLKLSALATGRPLEVVIGRAPSWDEPWARARLVGVAREVNGWREWLVDERGRVIEDADVQRARLAGEGE